METIPQKNTPAVSPAVSIVKRLFRHYLKGYWQKISIATDVYCNVRTLSPLLFVVTVDLYVFSVSLDFWGRKGIRKKNSKHQMVKTIKKMQSANPDANKGIGKGWTISSGHVYEDCTFRRKRMGGNLQLSNQIFLELPWEEEDNKVIITVMEK